MVHQYKSNGYNIVLDVNSGSVHIVDDTVYDLIPLVETALAEKLEDADEIIERVSRKSGHDAALCREAVSEILELKEAGALFTEDIYKDYIFDFKTGETTLFNLYKPFNKDIMQVEAQYNGLLFIQTDWKVQNTKLDELYIPSWMLISPEDYLHSNLNGQEFTLLPLEHK